MIIYTEKEFQINYQKYIALIIKWNPRSGTLFRIANIQGAIWNIKRYLMTKKDSSFENHALEITYIHEDPNIRDVKTIIHLCELIGVQIIVLPDKWVKFIKASEDLDFGN